MRISDYNCKFFGTNETLQKFLADVRRYEVPTAEEEIDLITRFKKGDEKAGQELTCRHLRFIYSLAKIYARNETEVVDYVNEGVIGFTIAMTKFDLSLDNKFITYAVWYVRRQMNYYLNDTRNMITRSNANKIGKKLDTTRQRYYAENGREPTNDEVREILMAQYGLEIKEDCDMFDVSISSINEEIDDDYTLENEPEYVSKTSVVNEYEVEVEKDYKKALVSTILSAIPERQADVMKMLYGIDYERSYSTEEVAEKYGITALEIASLRDKIIKYVQQNAKAIKRMAL